MLEREALYLALGKLVGSGIVMRTDNQGVARQRLYAERKKLNDPALAVLQFRLNGTDEIWIVNSGRTDE